jgi:TonB family protein
VLRAVAARLRASFRDGDKLVRYGGDEFVVVLPGAGPEEALALAERARSALDTGDWIDPANGQPIPHRVSFSIGVGTTPEDGTTGDAVLAQADRRLYDEKAARRASRKRHRRRIQAALGALALWRISPRRPEAPEVGAGPPRPVAAPTTAAGEVEELRSEVERLTRLLAEESRSAAEREEYERRIRELETRLARVPDVTDAVGKEPAVAPPAPLPVDVAVPATAPAGERRGAEGTVAALAAAPAPAPARAAVIRPPQLLRHEPPEYPPLALRRRVEATVELRLSVDAEGRVTAVEPVGAPRGLGFDEAARRAALSAVYRPGTRDGQAVPMQTTLEIRFVVDRGTRR